MIEPRASLLRLRGVVKRRGQGPGSFELRVPRFAVAPGDRLALIGVSGSGKSTLLDLLALASSPGAAQAFELALPGRRPVDLARAWAERRADLLTRLRRTHIGYLLQAGGLLPYLTVRDNIALPCELLGLPNDGTVARLVGALGLRPHLDKFPDALSLGERQRVAVARALAHRPALVLADEPTASIDPVAARAVLALLLELALEQGAACVVASHDRAQLEPLGCVAVSHELHRSEANGVTLAVFAHDG